MDEEIEKELTEPKLLLKAYSYILNLKEMKMPERVITANLLHTFTFTIAIHSEMTFEFVGSEWLIQLYSNDACLHVRLWRKNYKNKNFEEMNVFHEIFFHAGLLYNHLPQDFDPEDDFYGLLTENLRTQPFKVGVFDHPTEIDDEGYRDLALPVALLQDQQKYCFPDGKFRLVVLLKHCGFEKAF